MAEGALKTKPSVFLLSTIDSPDRHIAPRPFRPSAVVGIVTKEEEEDEEEKGIKGEMDVEEEARRKRLERTKRKVK